MGLHSKTRYVIYPQGNDHTEQMRDLILRAVDLFDRVQPVYCPDEPVITRKYAGTSASPLPSSDSRMMRCLGWWHGKRYGRGGYWDKQVKMYHELSSFSDA